MKQPCLIALTGGPAGGKTETIAHLLETLGKDGVGVSVIPEAATWLMEAGFHPKDSYLRRSALWDISRVQIQSIWEKQAFLLAKETGKRHVILVDRGLPDGEAFCSPEIWAQALASLSLSRQEMLQRYHTVLHLASIATDHPEAYNIKSNTHRYHSAHEAVESDLRLGKIWERHPRYHHIGNAGGMEGKLTQVTALVRAAVTPALLIPTSLRSVPMPDHTPGQARVR
jgi:predicted ATPase